jgi:hypothetical protein
VDAEVVARRYRCRACHAVVMVVPREVLPRRQYTASAIGLALALFALLGVSAARVRTRISTWSIVGPTAAVGWTTLRRWIDAVRRGDLFPFLLRPPDAWTPLKVAESTALRLMDFAPAEGTRAFRAFAGATLAR